MRFLDTKETPEPLPASGAPSVGAEWFTTRRFAILLALLIFAAFPDVVLGFKTFVFRDYSLFGYPLAHYHREAFWRGEIPLWNPLNNCGLPFLAQWNTMVLYPLSLFYLLLPLPWSLGIFCLLHLFLAGMGMFLLARRWTGHPFAAALAGVAFAFNGLTLACLIWPNNIAALGWLPWVVLAVEQAWRKGGRQVVVAALVGAVQMLAGAPEIILFTWLLLLGLWIGEMFSREVPRRWIVGRAAGVVFLVAGLAAAQLIPVFELLGQSQRHSNYGGAGWSMPPTGWANFLVPLFRFHRTSSGVFLQADQGWTSSYYIGIGVFALALLAVWQVRNRRTWLLGGVVLFGLILALGSAGHCYDWLRQILPLGFVRYPVKFVVLVVCGVPLLAAFAVGHALDASPEARGAFWRRGMLLAGAFLVLITAIIWFALVHPGRHERWTATLHNGLTRAGLLVLILSALHAAGRMLASNLRRGVQVGILLLTWLDVMTHVPRQNPGVVPSAYTLGLPPLIEMNPRPQHGESRAMLSLGALRGLRTTFVSNVFDAELCFRVGLFANCNLAEGLPKIDGFFSLYLPEEQKLRLRLLAASQRTNLPFADFLGVSQFVSDELKWTRRASWMPMVTAGQQAQFADPQQTIAAVLRPDFAPRQAVFLPPEARAFVTATNPASSARIVSRKASAQRVEAVVETAEPTMLVVAQSHYTPWKARVDGRSARLWRANGAFHALEVPAGRHAVTLAYEDRGFFLGAVISVATLLGCGVAWRCGPRDVRDNLGPHGEQSTPMQIIERRQAA